jgi:hypothetical protein
MRINAFPATAALIVMASAGFAQSTNPGVAQLAAQAGVDADSYSQAQISQLIDARRENDSTTVNAILAQGSSRVTASSASQPSAGAAQMARLAGVEPGQYSTAELSQLIDAQREGDAEAVAYILGHGDRNNNSNPTNPGRVQLAKLAGVSAASYTLSQLTDMQISAD